MAIVGWPDDVPPPQSLQCVICKQHKSPVEVSAGLYGADGQQAYACNSHFWDMGKLILGWADFAVAQRDTVIQQPRGDLYGFPLS